MKRSELIPHFYELTTTEQKRKEGKLPAISPFYQLLEKHGMIDEHGIYIIPPTNINLPKYHRYPSFWDRLSGSRYQKIFFLKRSSRYTYEPLSYTNFISIRYVYSGQVQTVTPTEQFVLNKNDLCLMNKNFTQSHFLNHDEDVAFSIILEKEYLANKVLNTLSAKNIITQIISDYILNAENPQRYIIFHGKDNDRIQHIIEDMLCEFIEPSQFGDKLIDYYLNILLIEMLNSEYEISGSNRYHNSLQLADILSYINENYRECDLNSLANHFRYTEKYLSRFIKDKTGRNFKDIVTDKKLAQVCALLENSDSSIASIMEQCGMHNETYFYKIFRRKYGISPKQYRDNHR